MINFLMILFLLLNPVHASNNHTVHTTISTVYYDTQSHEYFANTDTDEAGGSWTVVIDNKDGLSVEQLNAQYIGKTVVITYTGDIEKDSEVEIISSDIIE